MITAIIVAAGQGLRMGSAQRKQFLKLCGEPILIHTLRAFDACQAVGQLLLVVPAGEIDFCRKNIIEPVDISTRIAMVQGGNSRQDSVFNGLESIPTNEGIVLIHDGVRPLVSVELIDACIEGAQRWGACIPALIPVDTLKQIAGNDIIERTISRDSVRLAQTPQAFHLSVLRKAYGQAKLRGWKATDDASLVERMGMSVHVIPGMRENLKITTAEDLALAQWYLSKKIKKRAFNP
ncbi:MAG: 2-C-methyl-D-erythritol 4-phosphate cytidylyltransferase [Desulfobacteraceae bacterium]|jgi:2-C-methyl-D-erythritol 4-phosphate cytidylyltransferase